ncbi:MAG TPA: hypothetical protein VK485_01375 [Sphingomicrobium sp.]|nr:hypothetical protein [Sphingomicrobium sp.]
MIELVLTVLFVGFGLIFPWVLALSKRLAVRGEEVFPGRIGWRPMAYSTLAYVLAFNLTFILQELFLVLPKAMVPGLHPTLYHNNHRWVGEAPIADLFQGTGALAILLSGLLFCAVAARRKRPSFLVLWMAFQGLFQSLPQFVVGAITPGQDVGQAYAYLGLGGGKALVALAALAVIPFAGIWLGKRFLATSWEPGQVDSKRTRFGYLLRMAGIPAVAAIPILILFRIPRELIEVLAPPVLVALLGYGWLQLAAFRGGSVAAQGEAPVRLVPLLVAVAALLAIFQLVLRPGIAF